MYGNFNWTCDMVGVQEKETQNAYREVRIKLKGNDFIVISESTIVAHQICRGENALYKSQFIFDQAAQFKAISCFLNGACDKNHLVPEKRERLTS